MCCFPVSLSFGCVWVSCFGRLWRTFGWNSSNSGVGNDLLLNVVFLSGLAFRPILDPILYENAISPPKNFLPFFTFLSAVQIICFSAYYLAISDKFANFGKVFREIFFAWKFGGKEKSPYLCTRNRETNGSAVARQERVHWKNFIDNEKT